MITNLKIMKKICKAVFYVAALLFLNNSIFAQSVAINTDGSEADASATLDVKSTAGGMLIPRMTLAQRNAINSGTFATGLIIYQTDNTPGFYYYDGSDWNKIGTGTLTGTGTSTRVAFWSGSSALSSNANLYWDDSNSRLGIGTTTPSGVIDATGTSYLRGLIYTGGNIELNDLGSGDRVTYMDFHSADATDYESRILRYSGLNGLFDIVQHGTGELRLLCETSGADMEFWTTNSSGINKRMYIESGGEIGISTSVNTINDSYGILNTYANTSGIDNSQDNIAMYSSSAGDYGCVHGIRSTAKLSNITNNDGIYAVEGFMHKGATVTPWSHGILGYWENGSGKIGIDGYAGVLGYVSDRIDNASIDTYGGYFFNDNDNASDYKYGIYVAAKGGGGLLSYGAYTEVENLSGISIGSYIMAEGRASSGNVWGLHSNASSDDDVTNEVIGVSGTAVGGLNAIGIYGAANSGTGNYAGMFVGDVALGRAATAPKLMFYEPTGNGTNFTSFRAQAQAVNVNYTLPAADGSSGQFLKTDGSESLSWGTAVTGTGTSTRVAFWSGSNTLSSNANLYWDNTNSRLGIGNSSPSYTLDIDGAIFNDGWAYIGGVNSQSRPATGTHLAVSWNYESGYRNMSLWNTDPTATSSNIAFSFKQLTSAGAAHNDIMVLMAQGDVGIGIGSGTTAPSGRLHVKNTSSGNTDYAGYFEGSGASSVGLYSTGESYAGYFDGDFATTGGENYFVGAINAGTSTTTALYINTTTGQIGLNSSAKRYKENIKDMESIDWLMKLRPVNYSLKCDSSHSKKYGLIAEEVYEINPAIVVFNKDNQIETLNYDQLITPMLKMIQELKAENEILETKIKALNKSIANQMSLQKQINLLKKEIESLK